MSTEVSKCPECNGIVTSGFSDCTAVFAAVCALEYGDPGGYGAVHLLTVDAYALQHSRKRGPRSNAFHLLRLCQLIEHGQNPSLGRRPPRAEGKAFEESYRGFPYLQPPANPGGLTIRNVHGAPDAKTHGEWVRRYARAVWDAWAEHHAWAREQASRPVA